MHNNMKTLKKCSLDKYVLHVSKSRTEAATVVSYKAFHTDTVSTQCIFCYFFIAIKDSCIFVSLSLFRVQNALWQSVKLFPDAAAPLVLRGDGLSHHSHSSCVDVLCLQKSTQCIRKNWTDRCLHFNFHSTWVPQKQETNTNKKKKVAKRNRELLGQKLKTKPRQVKNYMQLEKTAKFPSGRTFSIFEKW